MRRIGILASTGAVTAALVLSGCGSDDQDGSSGSAGSVTVTFMLPSSWVGVAGFKDNVAAWEHRTGNKVKLTPVPDANYDALIQARIAAKSGVDIFGGQDTVKNKAAIMRPASGPWVDRLTPSVRKAITGTDGKIYGTPSADGLAGYGVIYNKAVFTKAGVTSPPTGLAAFEAGLEKVKADGTTPLCLSGKDGWTLLQHRNAVNSGLLGTTPDLVTTLDANKSEWGDASGFTAEYNALASWVGKGLINKDALTATFDSQNAALADGSCGAIINGTWAFSAITTVKKNADIGFFPLPSADGKNTIGLAKPNLLKVASFSKAATQAQDFLNFMVERPQAQRFIDANPGVSPFSDVTVTKETSAVGDFRKLVEGGATVTPFDQQSTVPQPQDDIIAAYQELIGKRIDVPEFTDRVQSAWQKSGAKAGVTGF
ncbi:ABC transporter substrate-binding protein [Streptomyces sp. NBC_00876]|uniref:ABC transporter substrate-binding protein n=1 Tax=Streptomyces sp. NBC_00876 TaxID=2975853 RepID=UPI003869AF81|nr:ABC transporter substrate-binding protein [Streptomyces sp. NBC_00876]